MFALNVGLNRRKALFADGELFTPMSPPSSILFGPVAGGAIFRLGNTESGPCVSEVPSKTLEAGGRPRIIYSLRGFVTFFDAGCRSSPNRLSALRFARRDVRRISPRPRLRFLVSDLRGASHPCRSDGRVRLPHYSRASSKNWHWALPISTLAMVLANELPDYPTHIRRWYVGWSDRTPLLTPCPFPVAALGILH